MPLTSRTVSPVHIFKGRLPANVKEDEIQCVNNGALSNLIRQMGSLSRHAHSIFDNVRNELNEHDKRVEKIHDRLQALQENLTKPEAPKKPVTNEEDQKQFKSINRIDRHPLHRSTMPAALKELYDQCDDPPKLHLWDQFRDDPKPAIKFYTDPQYFIDLWVSEMNELPPPERAVSPNRRKNRPRTSSANRQASAPIGAGGNVIRNHFHAQSSRQGGNQDFVHFPSEYQAPNLLRHQVVDDSLPPPPGMSLQQQPSKHRDNHAFPDPPLQLQTNFQGLQLTSNMEFLDDDDDELPPPPPPLSDHSHLMPGLASPSTSMSSQFQPESTPTPPPNHINLVAAPPYSDSMDLPPAPPQLQTSSSIPPPPPPPPPPMPSMTTSAIQPNPSGTFASGSVEKNDDEPKEMPSARRNLMDDIKAGYKLRKVQLEREREERKALIAANDVAEHLRQRMKRCVGDSSDEENDDDDDEWDD
uniref:Wiskott-Aldrich syndrome protein family member n=1 Tax=Panagrellus redivivus TaxID=6233 RepID=A0A7E4VXF2_PANRE